LGSSTHISPVDVGEGAGEGDGEGEGDGDGAGTGAGEGDGLGDPQVFPFFTMSETVLKRGYFPSPHRFLKSSDARSQNMEPPS